MLTREKIFNVYEKPEASDPIDRVLLLREGFSIWALAFGGLWLLMNRMWWLLAGFIVISVIAAIACEVLQLSDISVAIVQLWLQIMLAFHAYELQGWIAERRGYRFAGVLVAESEMHAERRYYEFAA